MSTRILSAVKALVKARETALLLALAALFTGFSLTVDGFFDWFNIFERSRYWVITGMLAVPMTFIIATAGIDLSVGAMVALCGIVLGVLHEDAGVPFIAAAVCAVLAGGIAGGVNGSFSSYLGIPPLVVTLATMSLFRGIAMGLSQARSFKDLPINFLWLAGGDLFQFPFTSEPVYFPVPLVGLIAAMAVGWVLLRKSWVGRFTECIGENETAARFAAIDTRLLKFGLYTACGLMCGIGGLLNSALYSSAKADTARGLELEVIACVVVGGTRISGGQASVLGSLLGLLIIGILRYGLEMGGMASQHIIVVVGALVIVTAVFNEWMASRGGQKR